MLQRFREQTEVTEESAAGTRTFVIRKRLLIRSFKCLRVHTRSSNDAPGGAPPPPGEHQAADSSSLPTSYRNLDAELSPSFVPAPESDSHICCGLIQPGGR